MSVNFKGDPSHWSFVLMFQWDESKISFKKLLINGSIAVCAVCHYKENSALTLYRFLYTAEEGKNVPGDIAQWLTALAILLEDPGWVLCSHIAALTVSPVSDTFFCSLSSLHACGPEYACSQNIYAHKIKINNISKIKKNQERLGNGAAFGAVGPPGLMDTLWCYLFNTETLGLMHTLWH